MYGDPLTPLEHDAIAMIVSPAHPVMDALKAQLAACRTKSREFTGVGFYTRLVVPQALAVASVDRLYLSDVHAEIDGLQHGAGFVLFVVGGMLEELEGFTFDEPWPDRIEHFTLERDTNPDSEAVEQALRNRGLPD